MKIAFTGGGTGGHVYPALALIEELGKAHPNIAYLWIGEKNGMEQNILQQTSIPFHGIFAGKLRRYFSIKNFFDIFKIAIGFFQALIILQKNKPTLLFSKGGFVAVPSVWAAALLRIPIYIHESDYTLGLANRLSAPFARQIFISFAQTYTQTKPKWQVKMVETGSPVRSTLLKGNRFNGRKKWLKEDHQTLILVMGGSQGAKSINDLIIGYLSHKPSDIVIVHQTGQLHAQYAPYAQESYHPYAYFNEDLADLIAAADVVISRAGAGAINEFGLTQKAVLLLPLKGHQSANAKWLEEQQAVEVIYAENATQPYFNQKLLQLLHNPQEAHRMAQKLHTLIKPNAAVTITELIMKEIKAKE